ncbi:26S proteasome subunit rpt4 [Bonamia ostreae]|uniref:26S proteasome subunit rpt4 n=1 Tax=Bonamia ostreae TaxID=126728 RepID=A0ABV2AJM6_9EUKA
MVNQEHSEMEILIKDYSKIFEQHADLEKRVKKYRMDLNAKSKLNEKIDSDLKALQNVGQLIGEILKKVSDEHYIVKLSSGPHYIVGCKERIPRSKLKIGARVALEISTLTIMSVLPREVDPTIYHMLNEDPGLVNYTDIGGLDKQIRDVRETVELPLTSPGLFKRVGIKAPKVLSDFIHSAFKLRLLFYVIFN